MPWYLNRGGQHEGPFEDPQILQMIQARQLTHGHICQAGGQQWLELNQHPPFGQALQAAAGAPAPGGPAAAGYPGAPGAGGPAAAAGYPGAPGAGGPAAAAYPGAAGSGAAPGGYAPAPGAGGAAGAPMKKKKLPIALVAGIALAAVLIVGGVLALTLSGGASPQLAESVPKNIEFFIEVPSVSDALGSAVGMKILRSEKVKAEKWVKDVTADLADTFDIKKGKAEDIVESLESVAMAGRGMMGDKQEVTLLSFGSSDGLDKLFTSDRFSKEGKFAKGGTRYFIKRKDVDRASMSDWRGTKKSFARMKVDEKSEEYGNRGLVWFADHKLLVKGHLDLIKDVGKVLSGDEKALTDNKRWAKANFESGSAAIVFIDSKLLKKVDDEKPKKLISTFLTGIDPFSGSAKFVDAGILTVVHGQLKGSGLSKDDALPSAAGLDLANKLPKETVAYIAASSKTELSGKAWTKKLIKKMNSIKEGSGDEIKAGLDAMKEQAGFNMADVMDAAGDQLVLALVADKDMKLDLGRPDPEKLLKDGAFAFILHVGKEEKAKKIAKLSRKKIFEDDGAPMKSMYGVKKKDKGFKATPEGDAPAPHVHVRFIDDYLVVAVGGEKMVKRVSEAIKDGKDTLDDDSAHDAAVGALTGKPMLRAWFDAGRLGKKFLDAAGGSFDEALDEFKETTGVSHKALRLKGDDRMTVALAVSIESDDDSWNYTIEGVNAPALGALGAVSFLSRAMRPSRRARPSRDADEDKDSGGDGDSGVKACDEYFATVARCRKTMPASTGTAMHNAANQMRQTLKTLPPERRASMAASCAATTRILRKMPGCR